MNEDGISFFGKIYHARKISLIEGNLLTREDDLRIRRNNAY